MTGTALNSRATAKPKGKPRGKPFVKGDSRININGAPKRGASMAEAYKWAVELTPGVRRGRRFRHPVVAADPHVDARQPALADRLRSDGAVNGELDNQFEPQTGAITIVPST